jgi:uncharacterized protein YqeY
MKEQLNSLIMTSMKEHNTTRTETLRAIKTAFMNWETSKEHAGKVLTEAEEIQIIKKMVKQREESIAQYKDAGRDDLAEIESAQKCILKEFLPEDVSEATIEQAFLSINREIEPIKKNMGLFVKRIKEMYPAADGKMVANYVSKNLK